MASHSNNILSSNFLFLNKNIESERPRTLTPLGFKMFSFFYQMKMDLTKDDIRKIVVDLPMDKNYKISVQDFCRTPILSDEVFKFMDRNNDGQISKGELKLARKSLTLKQIDHLIKKLDKVRRHSMKNMCGWVRGYYRTF